MRRNRSLFIIISDKYGFICEPCYSDSDEFKSHYPPFNDSSQLEIVPGFRYATDDEIPHLLGQTSSCDLCGEPFEIRLSENERMESWIDSESDLWDFEHPEF